MLSDSHCHLDRLDLDQCGGSVEAALKRAREEQVERFLCVGIDLESLPGMLSLCEPFPEVFVSVGVHPNARCDLEPTVEDLLKYQSNPQLVAIGETGLDYFRSTGDLEWQRNRFQVHMQAAREADLPLIVHSRDAHEDTVAMLRQAQDGSLRGVMHCFVYDWEAARQYLDLGFYLSFSGIVTFNSAKELQDVAARAPQDRILVETDSPYLAPAPYRGKSNQPAYVRHVAEKIAQLRGESVTAFAAQTERNFARLFDRVA